MTSTLRSILGTAFALSVLTQACVYPAPSRAEANQKQQFEELQKRLGEILKDQGVVTEVKLIEGLFTYNSDGVPLLGWIVEKLKEPEVKFAMCDNRFINVNANLLRPSNARCPSGKTIVIPWRVSGDKIEPVKDFTATKNFLEIKNKKIDIKALPPSYQATLERKQIGEWAAISYANDKGDKVFGVISSQARRALD